MKALGGFISASLWRASFVALLFAFLPFLAWVSLLIVALITLRKGPAEGFLVLLWACLPSLVLGILGWQSSILQAWYFSFVAVMLYSMAIILRQRGWAWALEAVVIVLLLLLLGLHLQQAVLAELQQQVQAAFTASLETLPVTQGLSVAWPKDLLGTLVLSAVLFSGLYLVLARWWQAVLFNPGQLRPELENIRLHKLGLACLLILGLASVVWAQSWSMQALALVPAVFAGLSLVHSYGRAKNWPRFYWIGFYILWLVLLGVVSLVLALLAIVDTGFNFRCRWQHR